MAAKVTGGSGLLVLNETILIAADLGLSKVEEWMIESASGQLSVSLPDGKWAYVFERDNLYPKEVLKKSSMSFRGNFPLYLSGEFQQTQLDVRLAIAFHDHFMNVVDFRTFSLASVAKGRLLHKPNDASGLAVGLRVAGTGTIPQSRIQLVECDQVSIATSHGAFASRGFIDSLSSINRECNLEYFLELAVGDRQSAVSFDLGRAREFVTDSENCRNVAVPAGRWFYLFSRGNSESPKHKILDSNLLLSRGERHFLAGTIGNTDLEIRIALAYHDESGFVVDFKTISSEAAADGILLECPVNARGVAVGLRVSGTGVLPDVSCSIVKSRDSHSRAADEEAIRNLIRKRSYFAAIDLGRQTTITSGIFGQLLAAYSYLRDYQSVVELAREHPYFVRSGATRQRVVEALVAVNRLDEARAIIREYLKRRPSAQDAQSFVTAVFRFCQKIGTEIASEAADYIASAPETLPVQWRAGVPAANYFLNQDRKTDYVHMLSRLRQDAGPAAQAAVHLLESQRYFQQRQYEEQCEELNFALGVLGVQEVQLKDASQPVSCGNLTGRSGLGVSGPLVSIIMTTYNSEATVSYALESLRSQSYNNLEILVVDDCSIDHTRDYLLELAKLDCRVRLMFLNENVGTYGAKNRALAVARGKYFSCQDSDDWAHPQKVEALVRQLEMERCVATQVNHIRVSPVSGFSPRGGFMRPDASSLMCVREDVVNRIGFFETVRAGADSEYAFRLERAFETRINLIPGIYSFVALSDRSISGGGSFSIDELTGAFSPSRRAYRLHFLRRHEERGAEYVSSMSRDSP